MYRDTTLTSAESALKKCGYMFIREQHPFGCVPTYKKGNKVVFVHNGVRLTPAEMLADLKENWRPADRESQDWFCSKMEYYFSF